MLLPIFRDLVKSQWRAVLEELKLSGESSASELSRSIGGSYMAIKTHCEELTKAGYVVRTRLPRTEVGRPEILYSLSAKSAAIFPQAGVAFTLEILDEARRLFGENAPEKLLFQYFERQRTLLAKPLAKLQTLPEKAEKLVAIRNRSGCAGFCKQDLDEPLRIVEVHNPLQRIFEFYPSASGMELRMIEELLETRLNRRELPGGRDTTPCIVFETL
jgi:predicted ArsR family transcriptional regulator